MLVLACSPLSRCRTDSTATYGASSQNEIATAFCADVSAVAGVRARPREAPDHDHRREALDRRREPEPRERDRPGEQAGDHAHGALRRHPDQRQPRQQARARRVAQPLLVACRRGRSRAASAAPPTCSARARPRTRPPPGAPGRRQRVQHHLPFAARRGQTCGAQRAQVMGDEVLRAAGDPGHVAHAELVRLGERAAITRRVGSASAFARSAARPATPSPGAPARSASAFSRSRQSRSQRSSAIRSS